MAENNRTDEMNRTAENIRSDGQNRTAETNRDPAILSLQSELEAMARETPEMPESFPTRAAISSSSGRRPVSASENTVRSPSGRMPVS